MILVFLRRLISLGAFTCCGYLLYNYGISDINSQAVWKGYESPFQEVQAGGVSSDTMVLQAQSLAVSLPKLSESKAISALLQNPTSGGAATHLMSLYEAQGRNAEADQVAELASQLWPSHTYTRSNLADYWLRRGRPDKQIEEWNVLLTREGSFKKKLFPLLMGVLESDDLSPLMLPLVKKPPVWWNSFFSYLSKNLDLNRLEALHRLRVASSAEALSPSEHKSYVNRLMRESLWGQAHDAWFVGLSSNHTLP